MTPVDNPPQGWAPQEWARYVREAYRGDERAARQAVECDRAEIEEYNRQPAYWRDL